MQIESVEADIPFRVSISYDVLTNEPKPLPFREPRHKRGFRFLLIVLLGHDSSAKPSLVGRVKPTFGTELTYLRQLIAYAPD